VGGEKTSSHQSLPKHKKTEGEGGRTPHGHPLCQEGGKKRKKEKRERKSFHYSEGVPKKGGGGKRKKVMNKQLANDLVKSQGKKGTGENTRVFLYHPTREEKGGKREITFRIPKLTLGVREKKKGGRPRGGGNWAIFPTLRCKDEKKSKGVTISCCPSLHSRGGEKKERKGKATNQSTPRVRGSKEGDKKEKIGMSSCQLCASLQRSEGGKRGEGGGKKRVYKTPL